MASRLGTLLNANERILRANSGGEKLGLLLNYCTTKVRDEIWMKLTTDDLDVCMYVHLVPLMYVCNAMKVLCIRCNGEVDKARMTRPE